MGEYDTMIKKGSIVRRMQSDFCSLSLKIRNDVLVNDYPPEDAICIVTSNPKEVDLSRHDRSYSSTTNMIVLKKGIDLICDGKWYGPCDIKAFQEVKKNG